MKQIITFILLSFSILVYGQDIKTSDFIEQIKKYDISDLWILDEFEIDNDTTTIIRPEPLGYIGENFQRFQIHFISAIKNPNNPYEYLIFGKTRVKWNICDFQGKITITNSQTYDEGDIPTLKQGFVTGHYEFFEDSDQKGTGVLKGNFRTDFYINKKGELKYDALIFVADGYSNNQFEGIWTGYKTKSLKKCNWGDFRIPDSRGLDIGAGEFSSGDKYNNYGWKDYNIANDYTSNTPEKLKARKLENEKWWIDK